MAAKRLVRPGDASPLEEVPIPVRVISGIEVADTPVVNRALEVASAHMAPYLYNHVVRSWLFSAAIAEARRDVYDAEVLAVSAILHDIGLTKEFSGPLRFEVEGANFARELALEFGMDGRRAQLIWDSIALNSTPSICAHKEREAELCTLGVGLDWGGWGYDSFSPDIMARVIRDFPRLRMKVAFSRDVCAICERQPETTFDTFARDFGARFVPGYKSASAVDALFGAPFDE